MKNKKASIGDLISQVYNSNNVFRAKQKEIPTNLKGPLFTFLVGAGFSQSAGVPSTSHLISALLKFRKSPSLSWFEIFDQTKDEVINESLGNQANTYFQLIRDVLPNSPDRHYFITSAVQWAAEKQIQMNVESILLATILVNGCSGNLCRTPNFASLKEAYQNQPENSYLLSSRWLTGEFSSQVFTTNFDDVIAVTHYMGNKPIEVIDFPDPRVSASVTEYPRLVHLHGRHIHYDLKNTENEVFNASDEGTEGILRIFVTPQPSDNITQGKTGSFPVSR